MGASPARKYRVFLSYSRRQLALAEDLRVHLEGMEQEGRIELFKDDRDIRAGDDWQDKITHALETTDVLLVLLSADWRTSRWCQAEYDDAMRLGARVVPVLGMPCAWQTWGVSRWQRAGPAGIAAAGALDGGGRQAFWTQVVLSLQTTLDGLDALPAPLPGATARRSWRGLPDPSRYASGGRTQRQRPPAPFLAVQAVPEGAGWRFRYQVPGAPRPFHESARTTLADLDRLLRAEGAPLAEVVLTEFGRPGQRGLTEDVPVAVGAALGTWLLGDDALREAVFAPLLKAEPAARPSPSSQPVRLRLDLGDRRLASLPWPLLSVRGYRLVEEGWTVEHGSARLRGDTIGLPNPFRILLIAPSHANASHGTEAFCRHFRHVLDTGWKGEDVDRYLRVCGERTRVLHTLAEWNPHLVWFHGPGDASHGALDLFLDEEGGQERLPVSVLAASLPRSALCLVLDACAPGSCLPDLPAALDHLPCLVTRGAASSPAEAAQASLAWLRALLPGRDPVLAAHTEPWETLAQASLRIRARFGAWRTEVAGRVERQEMAWKRLDRKAARRTAQDEVQNLVSSRVHRVLTLVGRADEGQHVDKLRRQLRDHLRLGLPDDVLLRWYTPRLPPCKLDREGLLAALLSLPDLRGGTDLQATLAAWAARQRGRSGGTPVLWLDWGTAGAGYAPPGPARRPLPGGDLVAWLAFAHQELAPHCPSDLRLVHYLAVALDTEGQTQAEAGDRLARVKTLAEAPPTHEGYSTAVRQVALPVLGRVNEDDVRTWLLDRECSTCPVEWADAVARAVDAHTGGDFEASVACLVEAERFGYDALRATAPPPPRDDTQMEDHF